MSNVLKRNRAVSNSECKKDSYNTLKSIDKLYHDLFMPRKMKALIDRMEYGEDLAA